MNETASVPRLRIYVWTVPRSLATVFTKCMSFAEGVQVVKEPITAVHVTGPSRAAAAEEGDEFQKTFEDAVSVDPESQAKRMVLAFDSQTTTTQWVKKMLESPFPGKSFVFVHDQAFGLDNNYENIPRGYTHTFLIRNPYRLFPSWKKTMVKLMPSFADKPFSDMPRYAVPEKFGYGELFDLMVHVRDNLGQTPIIIDADDLQTNTETVIWQYCHLAGVKFTESLLHWEAGSGIADTWIASKQALSGNKVEAGGFYEDAFKSTGFHPVKELPSRDQVDPDLLPMIDQCMPIYEKMYSMRIKP